MNRAKGAVIRARLLLISVMISALISALFASLTVPAHGLEKLSELEQGVGITQNVNNPVNLNLAFRGEDGVERTLRDFALKDRPILLVPVYFRCPGLCSFTLNGLVAVLNELKLELGKDFTIITFSINPEESSELGKAKAETYFKELKNSEPARNGGWRWLTGSKESIASLTEQIGFKYLPDGEEFAHNAALIILTPQGIISRYFAGVQYVEGDLRLSLVEAGLGKIGGVIDQIFLFCFRYDSHEGRYTPVVFNLAKIVGLGSVGLLAGLLIFLRISEKRKNEKTNNEKNIL